jgi:ABC-type transporter Mla MlaB component
MEYNWSDSGVYSVKVDGDWTVSEAKRLLQNIAMESLRISERALEFSERNPAVGLTTEIDLNGITAIDTSGVRILMLWRDHLERQGFNPVISHDDPDFLHNIAGH